MIKRIKSMPWGVKVAILFLMAVYATVTIMVPMVGLGLAAGIGTLLAIARVVHYLQWGG